jgi:hypothetical protein
MVWGLQLPSTFGNFFPAADFEGVDIATGYAMWPERLNEYYAQQTPEDQKNSMFPKPNWKVIIMHPLFFENLRMKLGV